MSTQIIKGLEVLLVRHAANDPNVIPARRRLLLTPACVCVLRWIDLYPLEARHSVGLIVNDVIVLTGNPDAKPLDEFERLLINGIADPDDVVDLARRADRLSARSLAAWPAHLVLELLADKPSNRPEAA